MKMRLKNIKLLLFVILLCALQVNAINVQRVLQGDVFNNKVCAGATMYIIEGNCSLSGDVALAAGSILKFEGGKISGPGKILSSRLIIDAPKYQIFDATVNFVNNIDSQKSAIANGEVSAHWRGAKGDGITYDCKAINRALQNAGTSWVVLDNLRYLTNETIVLGKNQKLRCDGIISYRGEGAAIDLTNTHVELDICELRQNAGWDGQSTPYKGSGVLFSGNVYHANINIDKILYFNKAFDIVPTHKVGDEDDRSRGIQYCKISWQYVVGEYGIYIDMVKGMASDYNGRRTWVNENQFDGGRLLCRYGIYSTPVDDKYRETIGVINGNVFNSIGFEGDMDEEGKIKCKAITLYNAWHNNFNDIRLSEGYVPIGQPWIDLTQCGYLNFSFKSQIPYSSVKATRCNHIEMHANFTDNGLGYFAGYDRLYILNENPAYNPLNNANDKNSENVKLLKRSNIGAAEIKQIYVGASTASPRGEVTQKMNFNDLFFANVGDQKVLSDKAFITVNDKSTLNISTEHSLANAYLDFELVCKISAGSKIVLINAKGKKMILTESGVYHMRPIGDTFQMYKIKESGYEFFEFKDEE